MKKFVAYIGLAVAAAAVMFPQIASAAFPVKDW
jgi:hypothetical protein